MHQHRACWEATVVRRLKPLAPVPALTLPPFFRQSSFSGPNSSSHFLRRKNQTTRRAGGSASVAWLAHHLNAARLRAVFALLGGKAHFGADREALELDVQHAVGMEVELPVVVQRPDEAVAFVGEQLLDHAVRLAVVDLCLAPALLDRPLQLLLDGAESLVDHRGQLRVHVANHLLLLHRQIVLARHPHLDHHAVAVALVIRPLLLRERDMAAPDVLGELFQVLHALGDVVLDPGAAVNVLEDHFRCNLHRFPPAVKHLSCWLKLRRRHAVEFFVTPRAWSRSSPSSSPRSVTSTRSACGASTRNTVLSPRRIAIAPSSTASDSSG